MQCLGLIVLLVAAASAFPVDKQFYRCIPYLSDHSVLFKEQTYLCDSFDGHRYLVAEDSAIGDWEHFRFARDGRLLGGGLGGALSGSQASAHNIGAGIGGPIPIGIQASTAQSSSVAGAAGGGGFLGGLLG